MVTKPKVIKVKTIIVGKKTLTDRISQSLGKKVSLTKPHFELVIGEMLEQIKHSLIKGEEIRFPGYFSLKTSTQKARMAMNLQTKKKMSIPAKKVPKARFSEDLKKMIKNKK